jgi:hypothetical protein
MKLIVIRYDSVSFFRMRGLYCIFFVTDAGWSVICGYYCSIRFPRYL